MRKYLLLTVVVCCMTVISNAQIQKGSVLLGGNISSFTSKESNTNPGSSYESENKGFHLAPSLGFVTSENNVWGFNLSYGHSKSNNNVNDQEFNSNSYGGGIFYRRYLTLGKGFYLFGQADLGYRYNKDKQDYSSGGSRTIRTESATINAYPGITYAVGPKFHLELGINNLFGLSYSSSQFTDINGTSNISSKSKGFSFGTNFSSSNPLNVGFRFVL